MNNEQLKIKKTLKDRLKKLFLRAAVTSAVLTTSTQTSFAQSSAENDKKTDNITTVTNHKTAVSDTTKTADFSKEVEKLAQEETIQQKLIDKYNSPALDISSDEAIDQYLSSSIGNLNWFLCNFTKNIYNNNNNNNPLEIVRIDSTDAKFIKTALAYYDIDNNRIYMQDNKLNEKRIQQASLLGNICDVKYAEGNVAAQNASALHEIGHHDTHQNKHCNDLKYPIDLFKIDRFDEKKSNAIEYLNIAHQYSILKQRGIKTIETKQGNEPIESLLEFYPGLKDYIMEQGFSINNKKQVRDIVKMASTRYDTNISAGYIQQHINNAMLGMHANNLFDLIKSDDMQYNKAVKSSLKKVNIGNNTQIDLTHCQDLLDNFSNTITWIYLKYTPISSFHKMRLKEVREISDYIEEKGILNDNEKINYLTNNYDKIVTRNNPDKDFQNFILEISNNKQITYADGLVRKKDENGQTIIENNDTKINLSLIEKSVELRNKLNKEEQPTVKQQNNQTQKTNSLISQRSLSR